MEKPAPPEPSASVHSAPRDLQTASLSSELINHLPARDFNLPSFITSLRRVHPPEPEPAESDCQSKCARVEDVDDKTYLRYVRHFPTSGDALGVRQTLFEAIHADKENNCESP